jgi:hypothetical protein
MPRVLLALPAALSAGCLALLDVRDALAFRRASRACRALSMRPESCPTRAAFAAPQCACLIWDDGDAYRLRRLQCFEAHTRTLDELARAFHLRELELAHGCLRACHFVALGAMPRLRALGLTRANVCAGTSEWRGLSALSSQLTALRLEPERPESASACLRACLRACSSALSCLRVLALVQPITLGAEDVARLPATLTEVELVTACDSGADGALARLGRALPRAARLRLTLAASGVFSAAAWDRFACGGAGGGGWRLLRSLTLVLRMGHVDAASFREGDGGGSGGSKSAALVPLRGVRSFELRVLEDRQPSWDDLEAMAEAGDALRKACRGVGRGATV